MKQELATQQYNWKHQLTASKEHNAHIMRWKSLEWETAPVGQSLAEAGFKRIQSIAVWMTGSTLDKKKTKFSQHLEKDQWTKALDIYIETRDFVAANKRVLEETDRKCHYRENRSEYLAPYINDILI